MAIVRSRRYSLPTSFPGFVSDVGFPTLGRTENRMRRFLDDMFGETGDADVITQPLGWMPAVEVAETDAELTLTAELPGLEAKDVDISFEDGVLSLRGEKTEEHKEENKKFYVYERGYGSFQRSFTLPSTVDPAKIAAEFSKGVLTLHLPKGAEVKPKGRKIAITEKK